MNKKQIGELTGQDIGKVISLQGKVTFTRGESKDKKRYLNGKLTDKTGDIYFSAFEGSALMVKLTEIPSGTEVNIAGTLADVNAGTGANLKKINVTSIVPVKRETVKVTQSKSKIAIITAFKSLQNEQLKNVIVKCMNGDKDCNQSDNKPFFTHPYSDELFNYTEGLAVYTARVIEVAMLLAQNFNNSYASYENYSVQWDNLIAGAILHSIGSLAAYEVAENSEVVVTDDGMLLGVNSLSRSMIELYLNNLEDKVDSDVRKRLIHLIHAAPSAKAWNVVENSPKTAEAHILECAINFVKKSEEFLQVTNKIENGAFVKDKNRKIWIK